MRLYLEGSTLHRGFLCYSSMQYCKWLATFGAIRYNHFHDS